MSELAITGQDLQDAAMSCRALAFVRRKDAEAAPGSSAAHIAKRDSERLIALASRVQAALDSGRGRPVAQ